MRITNKIMQRNNLSNINTNKVYQDKLSTQMSTQKKVNRPSDDPVVSIRALRLRSNVTEVTQYYSKNIPDAESWLNVTEDALKNLTEIITSMIKQSTKGSNGDLKAEDRQIILEQLKALGEEVYSTGDADYAGRYVFTGYRTDTSLSFDKEYNTEYNITEQLDNSSITKLTKVNTGKLLDITATNYKDAGFDNITENSVSSNEVYRIRLAYDDCKKGGDVEIKFGNTTWSTTDGTIMKATSTDADSPYDKIAQNPDKIIYVADTGELLIGKDRYKTLMTCKDDPATPDQNEGEIQVIYQKNHWVKGDLRPEHYFKCDATVDGKTIKYNQKYTQDDEDRQVIEYDVGFNQTIRVNSTADECFQHGIGRTVDDLVQAMQDVLDLETVKTRLEGLKENATGGDADILNKQMEAVEKALTLSKDKCQKLFESSITTFQGYLDDANLCITNCGTRSSKLELIENRMKSQKTTFETLKSENEDIDVTETAINLKSAEMTYEAALMATGKVMQTTLLNFI